MVSLCSYRPLAQLFFPSCFNSTSRSCYKPSDRRYNSYGISVDAAPLKRIATPRETVVPTLVSHIPSRSRGPLHSRFLRLSTWPAPHSQQDPCSKHTQAIYTAVHRSCVAKMPDQPHQPVDSSNIPQSGSRQVSPRFPGKAGLQDVVTSLTNVSLGVERANVQAVQAASFIPVSNPGRRISRPSAKLHPSEARPPRHQLIHTDSKVGTTADPPPVPSQQYLEQAANEPLRLFISQPLLVVLDLNGTILFRRKRERQRCSPRPHLTALLDWLFNHTNHRVMIWTSVWPHNAAELVKTVFGEELSRKLIAVWARDTLRLSLSAYKGKCAVYKRLEWIWADPTIRACYPKAAAQAALLPHHAQKWGQHNTILIDDSSEKAATQPHNHVQVPEFIMPPSQWFLDENSANVLGHVRHFLEHASSHNDVSQYIRQNQFRLPVEPKQSCSNNANQIQ